MLSLGNYAGLKDVYYCKVRQKAKRQKDNGCGVSCPRVPRCDAMRSRSRTSSSCLRSRATTTRCVRIAWIVRAYPPRLPSPLATHNVHNARCISVQQGFGHEQHKKLWQAGGAAAAAEEKGTEAAADEHHTTEEVAKPAPVPVKAAPAPAVMHSEPAKAVEEPKAAAPTSWTKPRPARIGPLRGTSACLSLACHPRPNCACGACQWRRPRRCWIFPLPSSSSGTVASAGCGRRTRRPRNCTRQHKAPGATRRCFVAR